MNVQKIQAELKNDEDYIIVVRSEDTGDFLYFISKAEAKRWSISEFTVDNIIAVINLYLLSKANKIYMQGDVVLDVFNDKFVMSIRQMHHTFTKKQIMELLEKLK
jgi:hypothetical protein